MGSENKTLFGRALHGFREGYRDAVSFESDAFFDGIWGLITGLLSLIVGGLIFFAGALILLAILVWASRTVFS